MQLGILCKVDEYILMIFNCNFFVIVIFLKKRLFLYTHQ